MTSFQPSRREGGFTLLELLLVIGVAALLLIGGIATYRLVSDGNKATEATRLLLTLRQESQAMAQQSPDNYTSVAYDSATDDADNIFVASGILRNEQANPFGGDIIIAVDGADPTLLDITFEGVTRSSCVKMFTAITNPAEIVSVTVGATTVLADNAGANDLTPANAAAACTANTNDITWNLR